MTAGQGGGVDLYRAAGARPAPPKARDFFPVDEQKQETSADVDLFGNPLLPIRDRRGRPSFAKTKENQDFVAVRSAAGWSQKAIAAALGCDEKTLRLHFSRELHEGKLIIEGLCLDVLLRKVREGHTPSVRQLREQVNSVAPAAPKAKLEEDDLPEPVGKKEQAILDAQQVPDDWGDIKARRRH